MIQGTAYLSLPPPDSLHLFAIAKMRKRGGDHWEDDEVARPRIIANRRAEAADPRWVEDVRARKLTIANGGGTVHGNAFNLEGQYGIRLKVVRIG